MSDAPTAQRTGGWVADRFGAALAGDARLDDLVALGLRRNPRRAHLLVSAVLGKHVPADPQLIHDTGLELGLLVARTVGDRSSLVLGFAETATGLGHCVAEALAAPYLHSTRRVVATVRAAASFEEEHSHATGHRLLPDDPALLGSGEVLVLVDDELSTGRTALNTIAALHAVVPRRAYVLAALVDMRPPTDRARISEVAAQLGASIEVVSLASGTLTLPVGFGPDIAADIPAAPTSGGDATSPDPPAEVVWHRGGWPAGVRESGRHGWTPADTHAARASAAGVARALAADLAGDRVLVLGTEELMYAPLLIARELAALGPSVQMSSTTRSPVVVVDAPGYPVRDALRFTSSDPAADGPGTRFAYNVARAGCTDIVLVTDTDTDTHTDTDTDTDAAADTATDTAAGSGGLVEQLRRIAARVHVVVLPTHRPLPAALRGPDFGSYAAPDVAWLLSDLSDVALEAPTEEREEAIQSGGAHYAESLPIEYQPDAAYLQLFEQALEESAARVAHAVGVVTEIVLAERGPRPALASLARAGTPVGVLMRRWARFAHGVELPHYAVSIVRGRGIDTVALRYLAAQHNPADVVFVDGWTGKGAIARELAAAVDASNAVLGTAFDPAMAVLADPGSCVSTFGTRADFLIPSACLNSTVSGLVSRTVLNPRILAPGSFHGAKFYRQLGPVDVSNRFLDAICARFDEVAADVLREVPRRRSEDRTPTWAGWADVERISAEYGIGDVTLVKPGVGETTRVLLRRVPWAVLVRPGAAADLRHVLLLAQRRGVAVHDVPGLSYSCVGLIHPSYTRGATGADGTAAR